MTYCLKFFEPLHITEMVEARNFKLGMHIDHEGTNKQNANLGQKGSYGVM